MRKKRFVEEIRLPESAADLPLVELSTRHQSDHPWVFRRMVGKADRNMAPGTLVEVHDKYGEFIGRGFFNPNSEISLRLLTLNPDTFPGKDWFAETIARAVSLRRDVLRLEKTTDSYRLIHS
jgi:23S rRNA (cytosine1962-C5)-methyltransferase